jgi:hypothetical protein
MCSDSPLHRITAWTAILGYVLVASGLPLPLGTVSPVESNSPAAKRLAGKDRSKPFPCMDKPCGCASAEQCFSNCCCHTPAERLAWAKAHQVEPAVLVALERRVATAPSVAAKGSCCTSQPKNACCKSETKPSCCGAKPGRPIGDDPEVCRDYRSLAANPEWPADDADDGEESRRSSVKVVILRAMLACGGIVAQWSAIGMSLPPPPIVTCDQTAVPMGAVALRDEFSLSKRSAPDVPPPRA